MFVPQETQEARKSFSKKDEEHTLSGREKRLAEQVSSYNVSQRIKCTTFPFSIFLSFNALPIFYLFLVSLSFFFFLGNTNFYSMQYKTLCIDLVHNFLVCTIGKTIIKKRFVSLSFICLPLPSQSFFYTSVLKNTQLCCVCVSVYEYIYIYVVLCRVFQCISCNIFSSFLT